MVDKRIQTTNNSSSGSSRWMLLAGAASITVIATASYLVYGYSSGWKGPAYSFWCPKRKLKTVNSPYLGLVDQNSEQLDLDARTWMERFVRTSLKRNGEVNGNNQSANARLAPNALQALAGGDAPQPGRQIRADSLIRGGTGRYAEELGYCIATEKGLLKKESFQHIQKIIEVYSKALLTKMREKHQLERLDAFTKQDWSTYIDLIASQKLSEVKTFNSATLEVLNQADIKTSVFDQSVELYMIVDQDTMLQAAKLSLFTPFKLKEEFEVMEEEESLEKLQQATDAAIQLVQAPEILQNAQGESDLLLFFDCLMQDYIHVEMGMDTEQLRAAIFKNFMLRQQPEDEHDDTALEESETPEMQVFKDVCNKLYLLTQVPGD